MIIAIFSTFFPIWVKSEDKNIVDCFEKNNLTLNKKK